MIAGSKGTGKGPWFSPKKLTVSGLTTYRYVPRCILYVKVPLLSAPCTDPNLDSAALSL